jgi:hypothetical protein
LIWIKSEKKPNALDFEHRPAHHGHSLPMKADSMPGTAFDAVELSSFDAAQFLTDEQTIAAYLVEVAREGDPLALPAAEATVERARAMNAVAKSN